MQSCGSACKLVDHQRTMEPIRCKFQGWEGHSLKRCTESTGEILPKELPISRPSSFVWAQKRVTESLQKVLTFDDAKAATLAVINDAGTFDLATGTGGFNGSLRLECGSAALNDPHTYPMIHFGCVYNTGLTNAVRQCSCVQAKHGDSLSGCWLEWRFANGLCV